MLVDHAALKLRQLEVRRTFDCGAANRIINDPDVFASIAQAGSEPIDLAPLVADTGNYLFDAPGGVIFFAHDVEPGIYEVHTSFLKGFRGKHAIDASLIAYRYMLTRTDCITILTRVPSFNKPAALAARDVGFEPRFERKGIWPHQSGICDIKFYELSYAAWLNKDRAHLIEMGRAFHDRLGEEFIRHGREPKHHVDEDCHDLYVGACVETVYGGQPEKAVILYNRWARWAGYGQISLVARSPVVIDIGDAVLLIEDRSDFKVVTCR